MWLKTAAYAVAPAMTAAVLSARARAYSHRLVKEWGLFEINQRLIQDVGNAVVAGPFEGLRVTSMAGQEHIGPYLLGTFEAELHPWWNEVFGQQFGQILDVGASFGYYAVGLARRFPRAEVVAFDTDWWARAAIAEMIAANGVSNLSVHRRCDPAWLDDHLHERALIVSDCEGYERELLCAGEVPALTSATMIVELHEGFSPGVESAIVGRFSATHTVEEVPSRTDSPLPIVPVPSLTREELRRASAEVRSPQTWLFLRPRKPRVS